MKKKILEFQNLSISFQKNQQVVNNLSFSLYEKETLALVGESGSGKSVTALASMKLLPSNAKTEGLINFENKNLLSQQEQEIQKIRGNKVSFIFQEPMTSLNPLQTIQKQIKESIILHQNLNQNEALEKVFWLLRMVGLSNIDEKIPRYPHQLSGGQRQRAMIAMALSTMPKLLLADEPTTALDVTIQAQVINLVKDIIQEYQMGVIFITHDLGVIAQIADDVAVMYLGSVVEKGPVNKILKNPKHPYTKGLLEALPDVNNLDAPLRPIPGNIPSPLDRPSACVFRTRCPNPCDNCRNGNTEMGLIEVEPGHWVDQCCINCG